MNALWRWLAAVLSRTLEPQEREAVCGDLAESQMSAASAVLELLGLVARRQAKLLGSDRLRWSFFGLILPVGLMLWLITVNFSESICLYAWFYVNNWTPGYLANGFRGDLGIGLESMTISCLALIFWTWTSGLILGYVLRNALWMGALLFVAFVISMQFLALSHGLFGINTQSFPLDLYRKIIPPAAIAGLVFVPLLLAMRQGVKLKLWTLSHRRMIFGLLSISMLALVAEAFRTTPQLQLFYDALAAIAPLGWRALKTYETC